MTRIEYNGQEIANFSDSEVDLATAESYVQYNFTVTDIESGTDTSDATLSSGGQMLSGITAYADGIKYTGTIATKTANDVTVSDDTVTTPAGYYAEAVSKAVASGTAGTPTATKGAVSNHSISVTPSVTNTSGYITGSTKTGTAVSVSASELVSGILSVNANGVADVTNYASVDVDVSPSLEAKTATPSELEQVITPGTNYDGLSQVTVGAISSTYVGSEINRRTSSDMTVNGRAVFAPAGYYASQASASVAIGDLAQPVVTYDSSKPTVITVTNAVSAAGYISTTSSVSTGKILSNILPTKAAATITPSETAQTAVEQYKWTTGAVTVAAIPSSYVGSGITQRDDTDITASGATVTVPAGYYAESASKSVASGSATTPATTVTANPSISVNTTTGLITATATATESVTPTVSAGYVSSGTAGTITVSGSNTSQLSTVNGATITPTETVQTAVAANKYTLGAVTVAAIPDDYVGSGVTTDPTPTASGATVTIPSGYYSEDTSYTIENGEYSGFPTVEYYNNTHIKVVQKISKAGYMPVGSSGSYTKSIASVLPTQAAATITPSETAQTAVEQYKWTTGAVTVAAIPSTYVGSGITTDPTPTVSGRTVTIPEGYYSEDTTAQVGTGSATTPATTVTANPSISVNSTTGLITATASATKSVTPTVSAGYVSTGTAGTITVSGSNTSQLTVQAAATITPSETAQTAVAAGKYTTGAVTVAAIPSDYVGSGITARSSTDLTASGATVTVPAGYYEEAASKSVTSGSAGTPTATKGTVSNHSVSVTPSVTNTTGYITGSTKTGTAVTVSASELVSGSQTITVNDTYDVTNLAEVEVEVPTGTARSSSDLTVSGATVTVPAGLYSTQATKSVASGSATTPATTVTANPSISVNASGLITATASATKSVTPTVSAGYVSSGTAGTITVSGSNTSQLTTLGATTYNTSTTDQTITSGKYITGTQTIKAVTYSGLSAGNIANGVTVKIGDANDDDRIASVTGTLSFVTYYTGSSAPSSSLGSDGDIYLQL